MASETLRLVDEIDNISGVSGGSFPAAYYGLYGDRIFEDFQDRFLNKNIQRGLVLQAPRPFNLLRLFTPFYTRSIMASQYYDRKVFDGATFEDMEKARGPHININATDLSDGFRFTFSQGQFDVICSDMNKLKVSKAVAASSAVPALLTPITLRNYAGTCGFQPPEWLEEGLASRRTDLRRYQAARSFGAYLEVDQKPYIHLVDGGISDNLGLRLGIEMGQAVGNINTVREEMGIEMPDYWVIIVVNAETDPDPTIDLSAASPSFAGLMSAVSGAQIRRYNLETLMLVRESLKLWSQQLSKALGRTVKPYLVEVSFDMIQDEEDRSYLKLIPTSFTLGNSEVEDLRKAGKKLLRGAPRFQKFLREVSEAN
jgi:NTE family protein